MNDDLPPLLSPDNVRSYSCWKWTDDDMRAYACLAREPLLERIKELEDMMKHHHESALSAFRAVEQERNAAQQVAAETQKELDHWLACYNTANKLCCQNAERGHAAIKRAEAAEKECARLCAAIDLWKKLANDTSLSLTAAQDELARRIANAAP